MVYILPTILHVNDYSQRPTVSQRNIAKLSLTFGFDTWGTCEDTLNRVCGYA